SEAPASRGEGDPGRSGSAISPRGLAHKSFPDGIVLLDQSYLPVAIPFLDLLLARDSGADVAVSFVPDKDVDAVFLREAAHQIVLVLPCAAKHIVGHTGVKRAIAAARQHVDEVEMLPHGMILAVIPGGAKR